LNSEDVDVDFDTLEDAFANKQKVTILEEMAKTIAAY